MNYLTVMLVALGSGTVQAAAVPTPAMTQHGLSLACCVVFAIAYLAVIFEEKLHLKKSKPMLLVSGIIWFLIALQVQLVGADPHTIEMALEHDLHEYAALLLFLLVAMTYINVLEDRGLFSTLRVVMVRWGLSFRSLFWVTGALAFIISPIADNLTTALIMGAVITSVGQGNTRFIAPAMVNVVVAANAGGAFSPFGDITTLMVWQAEKLHFFSFFALFLPALVNWLLPAALMTPFVPSSHPEAVKEEICLRRGAFPILALFVATIAMAVCCEQFLGLPPFLGMITGLSLLMFYTWFSRLQANSSPAFTAHSTREAESLDPFKKIADAEWDTLLFFFGVIFSVGGLSYLGYLQLLSTSLYGNLGPFTTNIIAGLMSSIVDNIPVMFAILDMNPTMDSFQWLLITLTTGVGGSLLSIGSAAGVALMGQARTAYTFLSHLKWSWAVAAGYGASIWVHWLINSP